MRTKAKVDDNQAEIVDALRQHGCSVFCTHQLGKGFPDLCIGYQGTTALMECKSPQGRLTPAQEAFIADWQGQVAVVSTVEEALQVIDWHTLPF